MISFFFLLGCGVVWTGGEAAVAASMQRQRQQWSRGVCLDVIISWTRFSEALTVLGTGELGDHRCVVLLTGCRWVEQNASSGDFTMGRSVETRSRSSFWA